MSSTLQQEKEKADRPVRAATFQEVATVRRVLVNLQEAGFSHDELTIVTDSAHLQRQFSQYQTKRRAGTNSVSGVVIGALGGLVAGGLIAGAVLLLGPSGEDGLGARWMAALIAPLVALTGGFVGAMLTRGGEVEATNYFDQSLLPDQVLVVAEAADAHDPRLEAAERVFEQAGAKSIPLPHG